MRVNEASPRFRCRIVRTAFVPVHGESKANQPDICAIVDVAGHSSYNRRKMTLDSRDLDLIRFLQADARASIAELARAVGLSGPTVRERLTRLEESGLIRGYRIDLDPKHLGWAIEAIVRVRPNAGQLQKLTKLAQSLPQVAECNRITGEDCLLMRVYLDSIDRLDELLDRLLVYGQTTTSIVQSTLVQRRGPPLRDEAFLHDATSGKASIRKSRKAR